MRRESAIAVESLGELHAAEEQILERLRSARRGEELFFIDPIRALRDVGVTLGRELETELRRRHHLPGGAGTLYGLVQKGEAEPPTKVKLKRLFHEAA